MADNVAFVLRTMNPHLYRDFMEDKVDHALLKRHIEKLEEKDPEESEKERKNIEELEKKRVLIREELGEQVELEKGKNSKKRPRKNVEGAENIEESENRKKLIEKLENITKHIEELENIRKEREKKNPHILHWELTPNHNTILHVAVQYGHLNNIKVVLEERPHLALKGNKKGETPLHMAAREGRADIVKELIQGAQNMGPSAGKPVKKMLTATNDDGDTALHMAARNCHSAVVLELELLVADDENFQHRPNKANETPLYLAAERGKKGKNVMVELLKTCKDLQDYSGPGGRTALHAVAFHYKESDIEDQSTVLQKLLVGMEHLFSQEDDEDGRKPLQYAVCSGNVLVMRELLSLHPDCWEMVDKQGKNILHIAVEKNMKSVIDYIIEQDWCRHLINQKNEYGDTPIHQLVASDYKHVKLWNHPEASKHVFNCNNFTPVDLVWSSFKKRGMPAFAAAYIKDEAFLGSEIDGGRLIAYQDPHDKLAQFIRFKEEKAEKDKVRREAQDERDRLRREAKDEKDRLRREAKDEKARKKKEKDERDKMKDKRKKKKDADRKKERREARKASTTVYNSLVIVAALIAAISSAAAFAIPGGYEGDQGQDPGTAALVRVAAFKAFIIANTVAFASSVTSILLCLNALYYYSMSSEDVSGIKQRYKAAGLLILVAIFALMVAFITAAFAVLSHSIAFVLSTCGIVCIAFIGSVVGIFLCQVCCAKDQKNEDNDGDSQDRDSAPPVPGTTNEGGAETFQDTDNESPVPGSTNNDSVLQMPE